VLRQWSGSSPLPRHRLENCAGRQGHSSIATAATTTASGRTSTMGSSLQGMGIGRREREPHAEKGHAGLRGRQARPAQLAGR
jgi:hypothetical protein